MITHADFEQMISDAVTKAARDGITGWGIWNPSEALFEQIQISRSYGCTNDTCNHHSHDPAAPTYKLVLRDQNLILIDLGSDDSTNYYAVVSKRRRPGDPVYFVIFTGDRAYHDRVEMIEARNLPAWCLTNLARNR